MATDDIYGVFSNPNGLLSSDAGIDFQGSIAGEGVRGGFTFAAWSNWPFFSFYHRDFDVRVLGNGDVPLDGVLNVTLPGEGDTLILDYAYVSIPEPATVFFAGIGTVFIIAARRRLS